MNKPPRTEPNSPSTISIAAAVDCVGSLATRSLSGNLYLFDTNKYAGSTGLGSEELQTRVNKGDRILWTAFGLECETYVGIASISIEKDVCEPELQFYPGTDVSYWSGTVKRNLTEPVPYQVALTIGARKQPMVAPKSPALVGPPRGDGPPSDTQENAAIGR